MKKPFFPQTKFGKLALVLFFSPIILFILYAIVRLAGISEGAIIYLISLFSFLAIISAPLWPIITLIKKDKAISIYIALTLSILLTLLLVAYFVFMILASILFM